MSLSPSSNTLLSEKNNLYLFCFHCCCLYALPCMTYSTLGVLWEKLWFIPRIFRLTISTLWAKNIQNDVITDPLTHVLLKYKPVLSLIICYQEVMVTFFSQVSSDYGILDTWETHVQVIFLFFTHLPNEISGFLAANCVILSQAAKLGGWLIEALSCLQW